MKRKEKCIVKIDDKNRIVALRGECKKKDWDKHMKDIKKLFKSKK